MVTTSDINKMVQLLMGALLNLDRRSRLISDFQRLVWNTNLQNEVIDPILNELAYNLEFYGSYSSNFSSYYGDEKLENDIKKGLRKLLASGVSIENKIIISEPFMSLDCAFFKEKELVVGRLLKSVVQHNLCLIIVKTKRTLKNLFKHKSIKLSSCKTATFYSITNDESVVDGVKCLLAMGKWNKSDFHMLICNIPAVKKIQELCEEKTNDIYTIENTIEEHIHCYIDPYYGVLKFTGDDFIKERIADVNASRS